MAIPRKAHLMSFFSRHYHKIMKLKCKASRYLSLFSCNCVSHMTNYMNLKLSKDAEKNHYAKSQLNNAVDLSYLIREFDAIKISELGLQSIDVGGAGDCFFRSVSHQLYSNSSHHVHLRTAKVHVRAGHVKRRDASK